MTVHECFKYVREEFMPDVSAEKAEKMSDADLAELIRKGTVGHMMEIFYQAAQDAVANTEYEKQGSAERASEIVETVATIKQHLDEGRELGLQDEEIFIHDEIYGFLMDRFEETVVPAAKDFYHYMLNRMETIDDFIQHVREVRDRDFAEGWLKDQSLEMKYLWARAEMHLIEEGKLDPEEYYDIEDDEE